MPGAVGEVFNLGHTEALTLAEIARLTIAAAGTDSPVTCVPWPSELERIDIGSFQGDFSKAAANPRLDTHDELSRTGIATTLDHYRARR